MPKIEVDITQKIIERHDVEPSKRQQIMADIKHVLEQEALEKETNPAKPKKEFVILISDPKNRLGGLDAETDRQLRELWGDLVGWVLQIEEGENPATALDKLTAAAYDFNASPKGRRFPVETIGEACESVPTKITKEKGVWVKTKTPVLVLRTDNKLPKA